MIGGGLAGVVCTDLDVGEAELGEEVVEDLAQGGELFVLEHRAGHLQLVGLAVVPVWPEQSPASSPFTTSASMTRRPTSTRRDQQQLVGTHLGKRWRGQGMKWKSCGTE